MVIMYRTARSEPIQLELMMVPTKGGLPRKKKNSFGQQIHMLRRQCCLICLSAQPAWMEEGLLNIFRNCVGNGKCHVLKLSSSQLSFLAPPNRKKPSSFISDPLQPPPNLISTLIFASSLAPLTLGRISLPLPGYHMHPFFCIIVSALDMSGAEQASRVPTPPPTATL